MTDFRGSVEGIGLPPIVRFLALLEKSGCLRVSQDRWMGEVFLDRGQVVAAALGAERGLAALDAMALVLPNGQFTFTDCAAPDERNIGMALEELQAHLDELLAQRPGLARAIPSLIAVPRIAEPSNRPGTAVQTAGQVVLDRSTIQTLLAVDGRLTIEEIAGSRQIVQTVRELARLLDLELIRIDAPAEDGIPPHGGHQTSNGPEALAPQVLGRPEVVRTVASRRGPLPSAEFGDTAPAGAAGGPQAGLAAPALREYPAPPADGARVFGSPVGPAEPGPDVLPDRQGPQSLPEGPLRANEGTGYWRTAGRLGPGSPTGARATGGQPRGGAIRFWTRPLVLAAAAIVLLALNSWDQRFTSNPLPWLSARAPAEPPARAGSPEEVSRLQTGANTATPSAGAPGRQDASAAVAATVSPRGAAPLLTVFDERFADNQRSWPNDSQSTAWLVEGAYRLFVRQPAQFVAIGSPVVGRLRDVVLAATFRKVGGPPGGGYGLIVRDQGPAPRDGLNQDGHYLVLEAGDRGQVGIWRREGNRWIDLVPWTQSEAVRPGGAANDLMVRAIGQQVIFLVNGVQVASLVDSTLLEGGVGLFVGGDYNEVRLERFVVQVPN